MITREGRVWIVEEDTFSRPPVLDIRDSVGIGSETGLLGIALHPDDPTRLFLNYTDLEFDLILAEYRLDESLRTADPSSARMILKIPTRSDFHKGGMIAFGPDGYFYMGVGDDGYSFNGQDSTTRLGSILRIDVDGGEPYGIPTDPAAAHRGSPGGLPLRPPESLAVLDRSGDQHHLHRRRRGRRLRRDRHNVARRSGNQLRMVMVGGTAMGSFQ